MYLLVVGKTNCSHIEKLESDYLKRIMSPSLKIIELKSHSENLKKEALEIQHKIKSLYKNTKAYIVLLTESGKLMDSPKFSSWLKYNIESHGDKIIFIIGGAAGFSSEIIKLSDTTLSLSLLTYPHKLARLLIVEQIYRAQTIKNGHPYHK